MPDVHKLLADLRDVSAAVNREMGILNEHITSFEKAVYDLKLGITVWMSKPIGRSFIDEESMTEWATHLGWMKGESGDWGFHLRDEAVGDGPVKEPYRLRDASREERSQALGAMPDFLVELKTAAQRVLKELEEGNRRNVPRTPVKA
jgi:hypothetical protein